MKAWAQCSPNEAPFTAREKAPAPSLGEGRRAPLCVAGGGVAPGGQIAVPAACDGGRAGRGMDENPSVHGGVAADTTAGHPSGSRGAPRTLAGDHGWAGSPPGAGAGRPRRPGPRLVPGRSVSMYDSHFTCAAVANGAGQAIFPHG